MHLACFMQTKGKQMMTVFIVNSYFYTHLWGDVIAFLSVKSFISLSLKMLY